MVLADYNGIACISASGQQFAYKDMDAFVQRIGKVIIPRTLVFCLCGNDIGAVAGYAAFMHHGAVPLLLDAKMDKGVFDGLCGIYSPRFIWAPSSSSLADGAEMLFEAEGYALWKTDAPEIPLHEDLALLLTTSGTTGSPKLVRLSKENVTSNAEAIIEYLHITGSERPVLALPMHYAYGLSIVTSHLMAGATLLLPEASFAEREFWRFAIENGFTSFSGVPAMFETIRRIGIWRLDMPSLRTMTQAGGEMSPELADFLDREFSPRGVKLYFMYGQTEATSRISFLDPESIGKEMGSIGKAVPGGSLSLEDDNGNEISDAGRTGMLVYRGKNVCMGYARCADDLAKGDENNGTIHTGDMAYRDDGGFYFFAGRRCRFVKLYGNRICLDHIESLLSPFLRECACVGNDSGITVFTTDRDADAEVVTEFLAKRTKTVKKCFSLRHVEEIPRSSAGKILYGELEGI